MDGSMLTAVVIASLALLVHQDGHFAGAATLHQTADSSRGVARIPQVWVDHEAQAFHTVGCKLITPSMSRIPRTLAKMQGIKPAAECAVSDAEAKRLWELELKKGVTDATRSGGVASSRGANSPAPPSSPSKRAGASEQRKPSTPSPAGSSGEPSRSQVMAASDYYGAERVIATKCQREWPGNPPMYSHCTAKQSEALYLLKQGRPFGADESSGTRHE